MTIQPTRRGSEQIVSHLLFADDMLIFSKGNVHSLKVIDTILEMLASNTELVINKIKSKIYFSKGCQNRQAMIEAI